VKEVAASLNYVPSMRGKSLSSRRAFAVGLVVERNPEVLEADPFFGAFIGGIEEALSTEGYVLALLVTEDSQATLRRLVELVQGRRVDGVFLNELKVDDPRIALLRDLDVPAVAINPAQPGFDFPAVRQDGDRAIRDVVRTLVKLGHSRIAHVSGPDQYAHSAMRLQAWREAMAHEGLEPDLVEDGGFTYEGGRRAAEILLTREQPPTAVFCANDQSAIGFMNRALEFGISVPDALSIVGYDGNRIGEFVHPPLATVQTSPRQLGREAARMLLSAVTGTRPPDVELAEARFVLRGSAGRLHARRD
jgi:DNA-binding LacI/PurR family transcriptional regulator